MKKTLQKHFLMFFFQTEKTGMHFSCAVAAVHCRCNLKFTCLRVTWALQMAINPCIGSGNYIVPDRMHLFLADSGRAYLKFPLKGMMGYSFK